MIPLIALMIGAYICTRMMIFLLRKDPQQSKAGIVFNKILAAITIFITVICVISIYLSSISPLEIRDVLESNELPLNSKEVESQKKKVDNEKQAYIGKIEIKNLRVAETILGSSGVFGEIKNNGDRTLREVEIIIYFLDKNDKPVFEKTYRPILVTKFFSDNKPLKPNYIEKFGYSPDDVPSEWAKKVRVKITNIEFE